MLLCGHWKVLQESTAVSEAGNLCGSRVGELYSCGYLVCVCLHHHDLGLYQCISYIISTLKFGYSINQKGYLIRSQVCVLLFLFSFSYFQ